MDNPCDIDPWHFDLEMVREHSHRMGCSYRNWPRLSPGAVIGHANMYEWEEGTHECSWRQTLSISILLWSFSSEQLKHPSHTVAEAELFLLLINVTSSTRSSPGTTSSCVRDDVTMTDECKSRPHQTRTWRRTFKWVHFTSSKAWIGYIVIVYIHNSVWSIHFKSKMWCKAI